MTKFNIFIEWKNSFADKFPPISNCPSDLRIKSPDRMIAADWSDPIFIDNIDVVNVSSNYRNTQVLSWGEYQVIYVAADPAGNTAYCAFKVYVTRKFIKISGPREGTMPYPLHFFYPSIFQNFEFLCKICFGYCFVWYILISLFAVLLSRDW